LLSSVLFVLLRVHLFLERNAEFLPQRLEFVQVELVLSPVLDLGSDACLQ
jgi:hypothetical protein